MSQVAIAVEFHVKPDQRQAFERIIREHARKTKESEPKCLRFDVLIPKQDDGRVLLFELYADDEAFKFHSSQPRLQEVRKAYEAMISDRKITVCTTE